MDLLRSFTVVTDSGALSGLLLLLPSSLKLTPGLPCSLEMLTLTPACNEGHSGPGVDRDHIHCWTTKTEHFLLSLLADSKVPPPPHMWATPCLSCPVLIFMSIHCAAEVDKRRAVIGGLLLYSMMIQAHYIFCAVNLWGKIKSGYNKMCIYRTARCTNYIHRRCFMNMFLEAFMEQDQQADILGYKLRIDNWVSVITEIFLWFLTQAVRRLFVLPRG